ncbi:MAG TPA: hypothetical protein VIM82_02575 [Sulfurimonas sp.]
MKKSIISKEACVNSGVEATDHHVEVIDLVNINKQAKLQKK